MLKLIDLLGPEIEFNIKSNVRLKSNIGGIMTIFMVFIFIGAFIGFGIDIIQKINPLVRFNRIQNTESPSFNLTDDNFLFALYDQQSDNAIPFLERMFTLTYDIINFNGVGNVTYLLKIPFVKCSSKTLEKWKSYLIYDTSLYYCFPLNTTINLHGTLSKGSNSILRIKMDYCYNNTDYRKGPIKNNCISKNETQKLLNNKRIQMNYMIIDSLVNTFNYTNPISYYLLSDIINTDSKSWSRIVIKLKEVLLNTDVGFFIKDIKTERAIGIDTSKFESFYTPETDSIFSHTIRFSDWIEVYDREYIKVQGVFAMMGGFINFSMIILKIIIKYVTKTDILDIFNENYCYIKKYIKKSNINIERSENNNLSKIQILNKDDPIKINNFTNITNENRNILKFNYGFARALFRTCFNKKIHKNQINIINFKMTKVVSFENLIKLTKNQKLMKVLLFEEYQKNVLKYCSTPKYSKAKNEFTDFINNCNDGTIDKKLYGLLNEYVSNT